MSQQKQEPVLMKKSEAAQMLGLEPRVLVKLSKAGELPGMVIDKPYAQYWNRRAIVAWANRAEKNSAV